MIFFSIVIDIIYGSFSTLVLTMKINPRDLRLFLAVCREGTISGAARAEYLSQPTVSVAISQLERVLDTKLFDRYRKGIELTPAGEALRHRAEAIEQLLVFAERETQLIKENLIGPMTIGGTPGALSILVPRVLDSLVSQHPGFELRVLEAPESDLLDQLRHYSIDLAVVTTGIQETPEEFEELPIIRDPFTLVVGNQNSHLPDKVSLPDLLDARWVLPDAAGGFRRLIEALFINVKCPLPSKAVRSDSLLTTKSIVRDTDYVTILPREVVKTELEAGILRAIDIRNLSFERKVGLIWLKERGFSPLTEAFVDHTRILFNV